MQHLTTAPSCLHAAPIGLQTDGAEMSLGALRKLHTNHHGKVRVFSNQINNAKATTVAPEVLPRADSRSYSTVRERTTGLQ